MGSIAPPQDAPHRQHRRAYLITMPRTASNLFVRILNVPGQTNARCGEFHGGYFFMPPHIARDNMNNWDVSLYDLSDEQKEAVSAEFQKGMDTYREFLETTEAQDKIAFVKEHANLMTRPEVNDEYAHGVPANPKPVVCPTHYDQATDIFTPSNPTLIPDNILFTFKPTLLIRHPAILYPSIHRAQIEGKDMQSGPSTSAMMRGIYNLKSIRAIYDFYASHFATVDPEGPLPMLIDAADFIMYPATVMKHFCDLNGFDFSACKFNWETVPRDSEATGFMKLAQRMLSSLNASSGIEKSKAQLDINIDDEVPKWKKEFGEEDGSHLEQLVRDSMPDYEYLRAHRFVPPESQGEAATKVNAAPQQHDATVTA